MEEQLEEVQQVLLYARAQRSSKQKEQPGQTLGASFVPLSAAAALCVCDVFKDGSGTKGTDNSLKAECTVHSPTESDSFSACLAKRI